MHLQLSFGKLRQFCFDLNVLNHNHPKWVRNQHYYCAMVLNHHVMSVKSADQISIAVDLSSVQKITYTVNEITN